MKIALDKKSRLYLFVVVLAALVVIGLIYYFVWVQKWEVVFTLKPEKIKTTGSEIVGGGGIGEVMVKDEKTGEEIPLITPDMPPIISGTAGLILKIESDRVIVAGNGTNFADLIPRTLTVIFTEETLTFSKDQSSQWIGKAGLEQLKPGMRVLIDSADNIRGRTEFNAKDINIL